MKNAIRSYMMEDEAIDNLPSTILMAVIGIGIVIGIGWFVLNFITGQTDRANEMVENNTNPGAGNEFNGGLFG